MTLEVFFEQNLWVLAVLMLWVLPWKGYALWSAARLSHTWWFVILLVVNTLAILDIFYIFFIAKKGSELFGRFKKAESPFAPAETPPTQ